jgi:hypothetical protein
LKEPLSLSQSTAGHTLRFVASLIGQGAQIASIIHSDPFVLV